MARDVAARESRLARLGRFLTEVRAEVRKVTWPTWDEIKKATGVIIVFVAIIGAIIGVMDAALQAVFVTGVARLFGGG